MGKDYRLEHFPDEGSINVGLFSAFENKGNYALSTVDITDEKTLAMLETNRLIDFFTLQDGFGTTVTPINATNPLRRYAGIITQNLKSVR